MQKFRIEMSNPEWIGGAKDDPEDRCLHGKVSLHIGDTLIEDMGTVSATALYLLKTLTEDKIMSEYDIQMIPCCGHSVFANKDLTEVMISGCDRGTDWSTVHQGDNVKLIFPEGEEYIIPVDEYRKEVLRFADTVEDFYKSCTPKIIPTDELDRNGYIAFWNEWHRRRNYE
ncbi:MAG: hypothetical protein E7218_02235 [Anaerofustis stercorihominis]|nr:hypothetical protein [Anaerofustis stercorihominis]